ncbi:MAG: 4Fe-4S dicluster domain-containing protein [Thermoplasmatota archaeon]
MSDEAEVIDADKLDPDFKFEIARQPGGENMKLCFQCGTCSGTCPVRAINDRYNPRRIIRMALLGMRKEVLCSDFIWLCATCYACHERCPQNVRIPDLMMAIRNIAIKEGNIHPVYTSYVTTLEGHGRLLEIGEFENEKRAKLGLPEIKEETERVRKIFSHTKMREKAAGKQADERACKTEVGE